MVTRCCNLSPRGDGNISSSDSINVRLLVGCNLSPRGDGNNRGDLSKRQIFPVAIYPREGTETMRTMSSHTLSSVAIYPREGTETVQSHVFTSSRQHRCNLSPRGDGNGHGGLIGCIGHRCNLSPRGDGNVERQRFSHDFRVAIYPREGTETSVVSWTYTAFWVAIYPREGTETFPCWLISCWKWLQFIPARGRKLRHYFSCDN